MVDIELSLEQQEQVLVANRDFIIKHLDADDVIDELVQARLIGENAAQRVQLMTMSRGDKNKIIFEQLSIAGPGALEKFCDILRKQKRQMFIAEQLEKCFHSTTTKTNSEPATTVKISLADIERLKIRYLRKQPTAKTDWPKHKVTQYIRLAIVEKEDVTLRDENLNEVTKLTLQGDVDRILKKKQPLGDLREIFHYENEPCPRLIVIMGGPGVGKTTLANEICLRWARDGFLSEDFDAVVLIPMRYVQQLSLEEVMMQHVEERTYQQLKRSAGDRCLIILEGLDEMAADRRRSDEFFIRLIRDCAVLEKSTILVTSRPHACDELNAERRVEVIGFSIYEIKEFVERSFPNDEDSVRELLQQLNDYPHIKSLCYVPLNLVMIIDIFQCSYNKKLPSKLTELYKLFLVMILQREVVKEDEKSVSSSVSLTAANCESLKKMLPGIPINAVGTVFLLCRLSFCGFFDWHTDMKEKDWRGREKKWKDPKIIFTVEDLIQCDIEVTSHYDGQGLLKATYLHEVPTDTSCYSFPHLSIQEFLSALYISLLPQKEQLRLMNEHFHDFSNVFIFLCGLTRLQCNEMYQIVYSNLMSDNSYFSNPNVTSAVKCLYESECPKQSTVPFTLNMRHSHIQPYDCYCVSYLISHYPISQLIIGSCHMGDTGAELLAKHYSSTYQLLEVLDFSQNGLTAVGMVHVMKMVKTSSATLRELDVSGNHNSDNWISLEGLQSNKTLARLNISECDLSVKGACCVGELLKVNNSLQELDMWGNPIGDDGVSAVADGLQCNNTLTKLNFGKCRFSVKGAISISQALMVNQILKELHMNDNNIGDEGITAISSSLSQSCSITKLNVMRCGITFTGVRTLAKALSTNHNIRILWLYDNPITVDGAHLIMKSAVDNGVCEFVWIDNEYGDDEEVKEMEIILDDRRRLNRSNTGSSKDDDFSEKKSLEEEKSAHTTKLQELDAELIEKNSLVKLLKENQNLIQKQKEDKTAHEEKLEQQNSQLIMANHKAAKLQEENIKLIQEIQKQKEENGIHENKLQLMEAELSKKNSQLIIENDKVVKLEEETKDLIQMQKEGKMAYALKLKQLDAELSKKSSQLKIEADKVIKLQEENLKLKQEQMEEKIAHENKLKNLDGILLEKSSQVKIEADKVIELQEKNLKLKQKQKEERIAHENKLKNLDAELLEKSSQLKIEADKVIELQEENLKLTQKQKDLENPRDIAELGKSYEKIKVELNQQKDQVIQLKLKNRQLTKTNAQLVQMTQRSRREPPELFDVDSSDVSINNEIIKYGSYYMLYDAKYCGKQCVAKKEHAEGTKFSKRLLEQEKMVIGHLKDHPCIVQPLVRPVNPSSVLLMESMWMSLTDFVTSKPIYHNEVTILQDVACGLSYIHEQGIIHCNLTGNSILLTEKVRAKLSDFGKAIFYQQNVVNSLPLTADILDYMPPEILKPIPSYSNKVDVFSFGCVVLHAATQEPPVPDCDKFVKTNEVGKYKMHSEIDRRSIIIKKLKNDLNVVKFHDVVLKCLQDNPDKRPTAEALCLLLKKQEISSFKYVEDICPEVSISNKRQKITIALLLMKQLSSLTTLNVSGCKITEQGADMIAAVLLQTASLEMLDLSNTTLNVAKAQKINNALKSLTSLKSLKINNNIISDEDETADSVAAVILNNPLLEKLNLSHNNLSSAGALQIANALLLSKNIKMVNISNNLISSDNIEKLSKTLSECCILQELDLSYNFLMLNGVMTIAQHFRKHPTLQILDLSNNAASFSSACEFIVDVILSVNQEIVYLNVSGRNIRPRFIDDYLSPPKSEKNIDRFTLQNLYLSQHASPNSVNVQTKFIKAPLESCPNSRGEIFSYYVDDVGGVFYNQYHNFALIIPPSAVSLGECVEILATASHYDSCKIPENLYPISSFLWISAGYPFKVPVYVIMGHYAKIRSLEDIDHLFVLTSPRNSFSNENPLMEIVPNGVYFDNKIGYCVLATKHFCSICQAKDDKHIPECFMASFYTYFNASKKSHFAEVCFYPSNSECKKVVAKQCEEKATTPESLPFFVADAEKLFVSSIDCSSVNGWHLKQHGRLEIHRCDFEYWRIFTTKEEMEEAEQKCIYPPRFQIICTRQPDVSKSLHYSFVVSKGFNEKIVQYRVSEEIIEQKPQINDVPIKDKNEKKDDVIEVKISLLKIVRHFNVQLIDTMPMDDATFIAILDSQGLFPNNTKQAVLATKTKCGRASYFLDNVITPGIDHNDTYFKELLSVMENSEFKPLQDLAKRIKSAICKETQLLQASQVEDVTTQIDPTSQVASEHKRLLHNDDQTGMKSKWNKWKCTSTALASALAIFILVVAICIAYGWHLPFHISIK